MLCASSEKSTTEFFNSVNSSCRRVLVSSLNPSCCRARRFSHARAHMHRTQQLTITNNPLNQAPSQGSILVITYKQFIFLLLSRSSSQTHNHTINKNTLFLSIFQVGPPHVEVAFRTPVAGVCVPRTCVPSTCVPAHSPHASQHPSLTSDDKREATVTRWGLGDTMLECRYGKVYYGD